ncbi:MAG: FHA domain-containing protein [Aggregatilineales bacterium]
MIALGLALISLAAGMVLHLQPQLTVLRALLYALGATSLAYWLISLLVRCTAASDDNLAARLIVIAGAPHQLGKTLLLKKADRMLNKRLCRIQRMRHGYTLTDQGAPQGVYLNGRRLVLNLPVPLHSGDEIAFGAPRAGNLVLRFRAELFPPQPAIPTDTQRTEQPSMLNASEASRAQFWQHVQDSARRTSVLPLILPSRAEEAPRPDADRYDT